MRLLREAHHFEYRDSAGVDQLAQADIWETGSGERAVLVLRGLNVQGAAFQSGGERPTLIDQTLIDQTLLEQARQAHGYLAHSWLPFVAPHAQLSVLVLRPRQPVSADGQRSEPNQADLSWAGSVTELAQGKAHVLVL